MLDGEDGYSVLFTNLNILNNHCNDEYSNALGEIFGHMLPVWAQNLVQKLQNVER